MKNGLGESETIPMVAFTLNGVFRVGHEEKKIMDNSNTHIRVEDRGCVRLVVIDRPDKHNAITIAMRKELCVVMRDSSTDVGVSAVVLTGSGEKAFCVGADLSEVKARTLTSDWTSGGGAWRQELALAIETCKKPSIAAMRGYVIGLGLEIALACTLRIAGDDCVFAFPELDHGIIPGSGGTQRLPRTVGASWSADMILTGRRIDSELAMNIGLVTRTCVPDEVVNEAINLGQRIGEKDPSVVSIAKTAIQRATRNGLYDDLEVEGMLSTLTLGVKRTDGEKNAK